jgi:hypothetical protein
MTDMVVGADRIGGADGVLDDGRVREFVVRSLVGAGLDGRSVCVIVPDGTRTCPMPLLLSAVHEALHDRAARVTVLVALGTHAAMSPTHLDVHLGGPYPGITVLNHEWWDPRTFVTLGVIDADRVAELSEGRLKLPVSVALNRAVVDHDVCLVIGPVFPHEVVGFSGGNKYFFPGVAGQEIIDFSHWLGASRIPHFVEVTPDKLRQVERAEAALRRLGFTELRVRHHGDIARIELPAQDLPRAVTDPLRGAVHDAVVAAGFRFATVDLAGVQSGAFTLPLVPAAHA